MAKKQLISTAFDELNQDLNEREAYFLGRIATNEWVSKTGIYKLHAVMLAATIGFAKVLELEEGIAIVEKFSTLEDPQKMAREIMSEKEQLATLRLKNMFDILQNKKKLKYDYKNHLMYVINFHQYVPFGNASPSVIIPELLTKLGEQDSHPFWNDYLNENRGKIKDYISRLAQKAESDSQNPKNRNGKWQDIRTNLNFIELKNLIFK